MSDSVQPGSDNLTGIGTSRPPVGPNRRRWLAVAIAAGLMLAVVALALLALGRQRGQAPAAAVTAPTTVAAAGPKPLRLPDAIGGFRRLSRMFEAFQRQYGQGPLARGEFVMAAYRRPDGHSGFVLHAGRPGASPGAEQMAKLWASNPLKGETGTFRPFPRAGLDIRCAQLEDGAVCFLALPDLGVVLAGDPSVPRLADLLAEAHRKLV